MNIEPSNIWYMIVYSNSKPAFENYDQSFPFPSPDV